MKSLDKICESSGRYHRGSVSRDGVQRDLLTLVEGKPISTKHGMVKTDHILCIASGAFHTAKKEDLMAEFQGRFPITTRLTPLSHSDLVKILSVW